MLKKLLKYDLKSLFKSIIPLFLFSIISLAIFLFTKLFDNYSIFNIISGIFNLLFIVSLLAILFASFFISIKRFYQNVLKDEGYLTNTLPVKKSSIVLSKLLSSAILMIVSALVCFLLTWASDFNNYDFSSLFEEIYPGFYGYTMALIVCAVIFFQTLALISAFYSSLSIGYSFNNHKNKKSILAGIVTYILMQVITIASIVLLLYSFDVAVVYTETTDLESIKLAVYILLLAMGLNIFYTIVNYLISTKMLDKKLNLE
ncbi:magnesium-transporting ATPase (P-type) [Bacilli bacterium PM5-3]|nr:magnesium-transporting ATPase (P-type) [Bacilli bacterium PM5-3]MDH6603878.1 magnesium-transporting ATPase (P-type) [Bacilli bacterium PM5-9]